MTGQVAVIRRMLDGFHHIYFLFDIPIISVLWKAEQKNAQLYSRIPPEMDGAWFFSPQFVR
jgi:hypothetical protein